jgi:glycosyltransferase involved in cell wall biosynthesis
VLLLHNFLTPYRVPLFTELARRFDFEVWILGDVGKIREWNADDPARSFQCRFLPHLGLPTGSRDYRILFNHTLPWALRRHEHDVLIGCGWDTPAVFYAALRARMGRRTPFVLWSGSTAGEPNWRRSVTKPVVRSLVSHADAWIVYGSRAQDYLVSMGAADDRVFRAYNTVETDAFAARSSIESSEIDAFRAELGIQTPHVVFYCGQLIDRKGLGDLIPALGLLAAQRRDVTLLVAGSGPREAAYRELAQQAGVADRVIFTGFVAREELPRYYAVADLFALPSREEVWGLVINEALACGVPVLTTSAVGASADLMSDGVNGYVTPAGDAEALHRALARHFDEATDRQAMNVAARESIRPFTIAHAADAFVSAVDCALGRA